MGAVYSFYCIPGSHTITIFHKINDCNKRLYTDNVGGLVEFKKNLFSSLDNNNNFVENRDHSGFTSLSLYLSRYPSSCHVTIISWLVWHLFSHLKRHIKTDRQDVYLTSVLYFCSLHAWLSFFYLRCMSMRTKWLIVAKFGVADNWQLLSNHQLLMDDVHQQFTAINHYYSIKIDENGLLSMHTFNYHNLIIIIIRPLHKNC